MKGAWALDWEVGGINGLHSITLSLECMAPQPSIDSYIYCMVPSKQQQTPLWPRSVGVLLASLKFVSADFIAEC